MHCNTIYTAVLTKQLFIPLHSARLNIVGVKCISDEKVRTTYGFQKTSIQMPANTA